MFFQHFGAAGDVTAGADAGDQYVDRAVFEVLEDFLRGRACVDRDIGWIVELRRHPRAIGLFGPLGGAFNRALHALFLGCQVERCAISEHQATAFDRHAFGHHEDDFVAFDSRNYREADAGIAAGRLDDRPARLERSVGFGRFDHRQSDTVLDRSTGIAALRFDPHFGIAEQALDADMRRVADRFENVRGFHG